MRNNNLLSRLQDKIRFGESCWNWTAGKSWNGYGRIKISGKVVMAHRVVYEIFKGPIPARLTLDHLCRNRACVNPEHLEAVTLAMNVMRGEGFGALNTAKTHCKKGHLFDEANTRLRVRRVKLRRICRKCAFLYNKEFRKKLVSNIESCP